MTNLWNLWKVSAPAFCSCSSAASVASGDKLIKDSDVKGTKLTLLQLLLLLQVWWSVCRIVSTRPLIQPIHYALGEERLLAESFCNSVNASNKLSNVCFLFVSMTGRSFRVGVMEPGPPFIVVAFVISLGYAPVCALAFEEGGWTNWAETKPSDNISYKRCMELTFTRHPRICASSIVRLVFVVFVGIQEMIASSSPGP